MIKTLIGVTYCVIYPQVLPSSLLSVQLVGGFLIITNIISNTMRSFDSKWFILTPLLVIISVTMMIVFFRKVMCIIVTILHILL